MCLDFDRSVRQLIARTCRGQLLSWMNLGSVLFLLRQMTGALEMLALSSLSRDMVATICCEVDTM